MYLKKFLILVRYYAHAALKRISLIGSILWILNFIIILLILNSTWRANLSNFIFDEDIDREYALSGYVIREHTNADGTVSEIPLIGLPVAVGPYKDITDASGYFEIAFIASDVNEVPLIVTRNNAFQVEIVRFQEGSTEAYVRVEVDP